MAQISTRKRGNTWEYSFEIASVDGKRKRKSKGGFRTKKECIASGIQAKAEYDSGGNITDCGNISYSDFLNEWFEHEKPALKQQCKKLSEQTGIQFSFHVLRHTHATILIQNNVNIKEVQTRLGHKNIQTTLDI